MGKAKAGWSFARLVPGIVVGVAILCLPPGDHSTAARAEDKSTGWQHEFKAAEAQAKALQVPLVIHFHASWCGPCRRMESEVLSNAQVINLLGNGIVGVKVDSDRNRDLVSRFGIRSLPSDVIISPDGKVLAKDVGSPGLSGYVARLKRHMRPPAAASAPAAGPAAE
ncbi:MAG: hypothetical protein RLZZ436_3473 [Planctomycetota bacterium]